MANPASFYRRAYQSEHYARIDSQKGHFATPELKRFIDMFGLAGMRCLEVGSGRGVFQDLVDDYTGLDLSDALAAAYRKPFVCGSAESLPFKDSEFDAIWSITVLEHVANPDNALCEMRRVLKDGGLLFLKPAWNCRWWNCQGIPVRPYRELSLWQKWVKATLPVRNSLLVRALLALPSRLCRASNYSHVEATLRFKRLDANYETFWMADSDACSSIDPYDAIAWFRSRGDEVLSHPTWRSAFLSRSEPLIVRIRKQSESDQPRQSNAATATAPSQ